jgi:hypothetical protein
MKGISVFTVVFIAILAVGCSSFLPGVFGSGTNDEAGGETNGGAPASRTAAPVQVIPNGTYTYYPRPRATAAGIRINAYLDKIEVSGRDMVIYLDSWALGKGGYPGGGWLHSIAESNDRVILQDLDNPARTYHPVNHTWRDDHGGVALSFQNVTATRFSLTDTYYNPNSEFAEIVIGQPDLPDNRTQVSGVYTFYPRQQATSAATPIRAYLDRVEVTGKYTLIYLTNAPMGSGGYPAGGWCHSIAESLWQVLLQDMDRPEKVYHPIRANWTDDGMVMSFENVTTSRFSLTDIYDNPAAPSIFQEIILATPD